MVGIQLTESSIRLIEGRKTDTALMITGMQTVPYEGRDPLQTLHETLKILKPKQICLALSFQSVKHYFFSLPALKKRDARHIIQRELTRNISFNLSENFFDFVAPRGGNGPLDYAVLTAPRDEVLTAIAECQRAGKKPLLITSYSLGLQYILQSFIPEFENEIYASLHIEDKSGFLSIFNKGILTFTRNFSIKTKNPVDMGDPPHAEMAPASNRIIQETTRSLLFFKQHSHGLMAKGLVISGNIRDTDTLKTAMQEELGIEVQLLSPEEKHGILALQERSGEAISPQTFMEYAVPLGLLLAPPLEAANLIPETVLKRKTIFGGQLAMAIAIIALLFGTGMAHFILTRQAAILREAVTSQKTTRQKMRPIIESIRKIKGNRSRYQQLFLFSKMILKPPPFWTPFWKDVSQIIPEKMVLDRAAFAQEDKTKGIYRFKLSGQIITASAKEAQGVYQRFIDLLFSSPCILEGNFSAPEILPAKVSPRGAETAKNEVVGSLRTKVREIEKKGAAMSFHLQGELQTFCGKESK